MATLKDFAKEYVPEQTKNISELPEATTDLELIDGESVDKDGKPFKYKYVSVNGEKYRVPGSVIGQIKDQQEANPNFKKFKVKKAGAGLQTRYTVITL